MSPKIKPDVPEVGEAFFTPDWWKKPNPFPPSNLGEFLRNEDEVVAASQKIIDHEVLTPLETDPNEIEVILDEEQLEELLHGMENESDDGDV